MGIDRSGKPCYQMENQKMTKSHEILRDNLTTAKKALMSGLVRPNFTTMKIVTTFDDVRIIFKLHSHVLCE